MKILWIILLFANCVFGKYNENDGLEADDRQLVMQLRKRLLANIQRNQKAHNYKDRDKETAEINRWANEYHNTYLFNWISYYDKNLDVTEAALMQSIEWRVKNNLDQVLEWKPPNNIVASFPFEINGLTEKGEPVVYIAGGSWDIRGSLAKGQRNDMLRYMLYMIEKIIQEVHIAYENKTEEPAGQFIGILDLQGLSFRQVSSIRVLGFFTNTLGIFQNHYPYSEKEMVIINAPQIFSFLLDVAKRVLSDKTLERIKVYDSDKEKFEAHLKTIVPDELYPKQLS